MYMYIYVYVYVYVYLYVYLYVYVYMYMYMYMYMYICKYRFFQASMGTQKQTGYHAECITISGEVKCVCS